MRKLFRFLDPTEMVPVRLGGRRPPQWRTAIMAFRDLSGTKTLMRVLGARVLKCRALYNYVANTRLPTLAEARIGGRRVGIVGLCIWGGPHTAAIVEELKVLGVRTVIGFGACGGFDPRIEKGEQVVVSSALQTDGTSRWYARGTVRAHPRLLRMTRSAAGREGVRVHSVVAATMDALYRETPGAVRKWRRNGAQVVNMESAAFYAAAKSCGMRAVWIGHVSDRLLGKKWEDWYEDMDDMTATSARLIRSLLGSLQP